MNLRVEESLYLDEGWVKFVWFRIDVLDGSSNNFPTPYILLFFSDGLGSYSVPVRR